MVKVSRRVAQTRTHMYMYTYMYTRTNTYTYTLARLCRVILDIARDSADVDIWRSFEKVSRKTHPDHGGSGEHQQTLNDTYPAREQSKRDAKGRGRGRQRSTATPPHGASGVLLPLRGQAEIKKAFRFQSAAVLLTYQNFETKSVWVDFVAHVRESTTSGSQMSHRKISSKVEIPNFDFGIPC